MWANARLTRIDPMVLSHCDPDACPRKLAESEPDLGPTLRKLTPMQAHGRRRIISCQNGMKSRAVSVLAALISRRIPPVSHRDFRDQMKTIFIFIL